MTLARPNVVKSTVLFERGKGLFLIKMLLARPRPFFAVSVLHWWFDRRTADATTEHMNMPCRWISTPVPVKNTFSSNSYQTIDLYERAAPRRWWHGALQQSANQINPSDRHFHCSKDLLVSPHHCHNWGQVNSIIYFNYIILAKRKELWMIISDF